jgi:hypothetical protein
MTKNVHFDSFSHIARDFGVLWQMFVHLYKAEVGRDWFKTRQ